MNEKGRLRMLGEGELLEGSLPGEAGQMEPEDLVRLLKDLQGLRKGARKLSAHSHSLGPLSGE
jgi:hypothetical protein